MDLDVFSFPGCVFISFRVTKTHSGIILREWPFFFLSFSKSTSEITWFAFSLSTAYKSYLAVSNFLRSYLENPRVHEKSVAGIL